MKKTLSFLVFMALLVGACVGDETSVVEEESEAVPGGPLLTITDGTTEVTYSYEELQAFPPVEASFGDVDYVGVPLYVLLSNAGFDANVLRVVKAVAVDGFSANYEPSQFLAEDTLVAYTRVEGELADDEKPFRMVLPAEGGALNVRLLSRIEVIP